MENTSELTQNKISLQDEETRNRIRIMLIKGLEIKEICRELGVEDDTWYMNKYRNTSGFSDFLIDCKKQRFLKLTETVSNEILEMQTDENPRLLATKQKEAEFVRETLLKDHGYTKRSEVVGFNLNKTEPLDADQMARLDKLLTKDVNVVQSTESKNQ